LIIDNPDCVEQGLTQDYWEIREIYQTSKTTNECKLPYKTLQ
jgi:hypothetical protein